MEFVRTLADNIRCSFSDIADIMLIALPFCILGGFIIAVIDFMRRY